MNILFNISSWCLWCTCLWGRQWMGRGRTRNLHATKLTQEIVILQEETKWSKEISVIKKAYFALTVALNLSMLLFIMLWAKRQPTLYRLSVTYPKKYAWSKASQPVFFPNSHFSKKKPKQNTTPPQKKSTPKKTNPKKTPNNTWLVQILTS